MAKFYGKKKYTKKATKKATVSAPVKNYVKAVVQKSALERKNYCVGGSGTLNNSTFAGQYAAIFDMGLIPRYEGTSTTTQEGSLTQARVKDNVRLTRINFKLVLKNSSSYNQFVRLYIFKNSNMYEQYVTDGQNMNEDTTGTQISFSTDLLAGIRQRFNHDLIKSKSDLILDKVYRLPADGSGEGGNLPISYIREINLSKVINKHIKYESAPDDVSQVSPKDGKYIIFFHHIHGQGATLGNTLINFEWCLDQIYEE